MPETFLAVNKEETPNAGQDLENGDVQRDIEMPIMPLEDDEVNSVQLKEPQMDQELQKDLLAVPLQPEAAMARGQTLAEKDFEDINNENKGKEFARSKSLAGTSTIDFKQPQSMANATDLVSNAEMSLKKPKDKYMAELAELNLKRGATLHEMDFGQAERNLDAI